ncbi:epimerase family protein SDR39U1 homolog, chloroplastic isoform X4 [Elaeis guineensis]|uniref:Epimerase family protein SDR39U1 homolog, chloroplastic isoform X4 n=1 Tax=Elaeis guineensis var. tenera TaxID=51953 RepID=A0A6I9Q9T8_ELAGV|nr:epimerase family protein SDR39U1 homolog, chloroplastic isoform X4 [Elaeis guineensis]
MELCRATLSRAPFLPAAPPSLPVRDFRKRRVVCLSSGKSESTESPKDTQMVVSVTGATGFIGRRLVQKLLADKHKVRVLTRSITKARFVFPGKKIKKEIMQSRINVTSKVVDLINHTNAEVRPSVLVSATAIGYYGTSETQVFDETSPSGNDYLSEVCREWETKAHNVDNGVRLVLIRIGVVLGKDGGALAKMIPLFMMFAGGPLGTGNQWFSWIHLDDLVNLICQSLTNPSYKGVINGTAPNPVRLSEMCDQLGQVIGRPSWLPVPDFAIKAVLGEGASIVLEGQRVLPAKAKELGFSYKYPYVKDALKAIVREL